MVTTDTAPRTPYRGKTTKAERTRAHILETALSLFREHGYDGATMRRIAEAAGVSAGSAYYYFPSKEHLIQGFYARSHVEHLEFADPILDRETKFEDRLLGVLRAKFDTAAPYHAFSAGLFKTAADPASPLSPFSPESAPTRRDATALFARVLDGTRIRRTGALYAELPNLLWLYQMGLILFWVHDRSPGQARSHRLAERTVPIVCRLIRLGGNPLLAPLVRSVLRLLSDLRSLEAPNGEVKPATS
ncbi:MAG: TetR family transcriptional regulator [Planctomycetota bacterium]